MNRLFIALEIPEQIRNFITAERKKIYEGDLRWEHESKLHLTMKFIGDFPEQMVQDLQKALSFIESYPSFSLSLSDYGFFFSRREPRILWISLSSDDNLFNLVNDLNKHLVKFNIPVDERLFKPHLTLLRVPKNKGSDIVEAFRGIKIMNKVFTSDRVVLYKSELSPLGSKYTPLQVYKLKK